MHPFQDMQKHAEKYRPKTTNKYICTASGRYLVVPDSSTPWNCSVWPVNWPIQSAASDLTAITVVRTVDAFEAEGMRAVVVFNTHDSIGIDSPPDEVQNVIGIVREIGENPDKRFRMKVHAKMDFEVGDNMGSTKKLEDTGMKKGGSKDALMVAAATQ